MLSGVAGRERFALGRPWLADDRGRERDAAFAISSASSCVLMLCRTSLRSSRFSWARSASFSRQFMYSVSCDGMNDEPSFFRCGSRWPFALVTVRIFRERCAERDERRDEPLERDPLEEEPATELGPLTCIPQAEGISQFPREVALKDFSREARAREAGR